MDEVDNPDCPVKVLRECRPLNDVKLCFKSDGKKICPVYGIPVEDAAPDWCWK